MNRNIILCGVGGQGIVLASKLISAAAMRKEIPVMSAETIGMAQRGGSVTSHLRLGENIYCPMIGIGEADLILGFEPSETVRMLPYLKQGGRVVSSSLAVMPVTSALHGDYKAETMLEYLKDNVDDLLIVDTKQALKDVGSSKVLNLVLLGAALSKGALGFSYDDIKKAISDTIPEKFQKLNFEALEYTKNAALT